MNTVILRAKNARFYKNQQLLYKNTLNFQLDNQKYWSFLGNDTKTLVNGLFNQQIINKPANSIEYPLIGNNNIKYPHQLYNFVNFSTRLSNSSDFIDYTARYGSLKDNKVTTREFLLSKIKNTERASEIVQKVTFDLDLFNLLDKPLIALSNGQSRRLKIAEALINQKHLLILEEPFTGLDPPSRLKLSEVLKRLHSHSNPVVLLLLKNSDEIPESTTNILQITDDNYIELGRKDKVLSTITSNNKFSTPSDVGLGKVNQDKILIDLKDINISYRSTPILRNINWTIKPGERWHLQGYNGSGKTTLLSLITGDHPHSFTQNITLFNSPRVKIPTVHLSTLIGSISPEITSAFPKHTTLTAFDVVASGFSGIFCYRPTKLQHEKDRVHHLLKHLTPGLDSNTPFISLTTSQKSCILLARALVNKPPLLLLDEPFQGMSTEDLHRSRHYLQFNLDDEQSVVFITHYDNEVPWRIDQSRYLRLKDGKIDSIH
ncbi:P-loop containing nucleoside triphosphate hydrolase protein [Wallemia mellicola]|nr:P-loop containing nucleoside triphosphate hydrolase protein [Wallemia mellicola]